MWKIKFRNVKGIRNNMHSKNKKLKLSDIYWILILILQKLSKRCSIRLIIICAYQKCGIMNISKYDWLWK